MKRMFLLAAVAALTTLSLAGCSKGNTTTASNEVQATTAAPTSEKATPTTKQSGSDSPDTTARRTTGSTGTTTRSGSTSSTLPGIPNTPTVPDITDIPGVPKNVQKCVDISTAYLALFAPLAGNYNDEAIQQAIATLERIKGEVPDKVRDALQTLEDGIKSVKSQADMVQFLSSDEYKNADQIVSNYVTVECDKAN